MDEVEPKPLQSPERAARRHGACRPNDEDRPHGQRAIRERSQWNRQGGRGQVEHPATLNPVKRLVDYLQSATPRDTLPRYSPLLTTSDDRRASETERTPRSEAASRDALPAARQRRKPGSSGPDTARTTATEADGCVGAGPPGSPAPDPAARWMKKMESVLGPVFAALEGDRLCVLVCTGRLDDSRIVPVSFRVDAEEEYRWEAMRNKTEELRGIKAWLTGWKRWLGRGEVELVDIRILGPNPARSGELCGMARPAEVKGTIARLRADAKSYGDVPRHGPDEDDESHCYYDPAAAKVEHRPCCFWWDPDPDYVDRSDCCIEQQLHRLGQIERLEAAPLWSMALEHPRLAAGSSLLARDAVYSSWDLHYDLQRHRKRGYVDGVAEMEFRGYRVVWPEDGAELAAAARCCAAAAAALLAVVLGARAVHGDWGTAYTAGAFYVALVGVLSTWVGCSSGLGKLGRKV